MSVIQSGRKLTVAHFMPWSGIGGVEIATVRLADALADKVHSVAFCLPDATKLIDSFQSIGVETRTYSPPEPSFRRLSRFRRESRIVADQIRAVGADIVHFSDEKAAYHNSLAALISGAHRVCHMRVSYPELELRRRVCLRPVQLFLFVSDEARRSFAINLPPPKARVVYDAIDIPDIETGENRASVRQEFQIPGSCTIVGMVARVSPQKDYFTLAAAAVEVLKIDPDTRFLIVGDNSMVDLNRLHYADVSKHLTGLGIRDKFIFTGHRQDTTRLTAAMDFCVLSTHREGFPLSILEAMALRKPVCATDVGGISEIVKPGVNGFLNQHEDSRALANAILQLIQNSEMRCQMGIAAQDHVRHEHSREKYIAQMQQAYSEVMLM
jgi:glycosyltransferase involved in cell wall biosynthesis